MRSTTLLLFTVLASSILPGLPLPVPKETLQSRADNQGTDSHAALQGMATAALAAMPEKSRSSDTQGTDNHHAALPGMAAAALAAIPETTDSSNKKRPLEHPGPSREPEPAGEPEQKKQATGHSQGPVVTFLNILGEENTVGQSLSGPDDPQRRKWTLTRAIFNEVLGEHLDFTPVEYVGSYNEEEGPVDNPKDVAPRRTIFKIDWPGHPKGPVWFGCFATGHDFAMRWDKGHKERKPRQVGKKRYIGIMRGSPARNTFVPAQALGEPREARTSDPTTATNPAVLAKRKEEWKRLGEEFNAKFMVPGPQVQAHT